MRSLIILEVEHGEDTDDLDAFASYVADPGTEHDITVIGYGVRVDVPECFRLDA